MLFSTFTCTISRSITNNSSTTPDGYCLPTSPQQRDNEPLPMGLEFSPDLPLSPLVEYIRNSALFRGYLNRTLNAQFAGLKNSSNAVPHQLRVLSFLMLNFSEAACESFRDGEAKLFHPLILHPKDLASANHYPRLNNQPPDNSAMPIRCLCRTALESLRKKSGWK